MSNKVCNIGYKTQKNAHISSTDQQVRVREKNIRNGINIEITVNIPKLFALSI